MPLVNCPECGREISDAASACPHCGYPLSAPSPSDPRPARRSTPLGDVETNGAAGTFWLALAIIGIPATIFVLIFAVIPGVLILFGDLIFWGLASNALHGVRRGTCPYCGGDVTVTDPKASAMKCPHCKKRFAIKEDVLETLE